MADTLSNLSDSALIDVATQASNAFDADIANYPGVTMVQVTALKAKTSTFSTDLGDHVSKQAAAKSATAVKEASRDLVEDLLRQLRNIAKAAGASEAAMAALGIPTGSAKAPPSATFPAASVNTSERLRHTLEWRDNATPNNRKKPRGVMGVEIWVKIGGTPPGSEKECTFLTLDAFTPYLAEYDSTDAGQIAHYMLRWRMLDGSVGAWGETVSATITA